MRARSVIFSRFRLFLIESTITMNSQLRIFLINKQLLKIMELRNVCILGILNGIICGQVLLAIGEHYYREDMEELCKSPTKKDLPNFDTWLMNKLERLAYLPKKIPSKWVRNF